KEAIDQHPIARIRTEFNEGRNFSISIYPYSPDLPTDRHDNVGERLQAHFLKKILEYLLPQAANTRRSFSEKILNLFGIGGGPQKLMFAIEDWAERDRRSDFFHSWWA